MLRRSRSRTLVGALLLVSAMAMSPLLAQGQRLVVHMQEPFEFGGRVHSPGLLTLRYVIQYNPGAVLDEVWVGTECLGLMVAEKTRHAPSTHDAVIFERNTAGRLVLLGYVLRGSDNAYLYRTTAGRASLRLDPGVAGDALFLASR